MLLRNKDVTSKDLDLYLANTKEGDKDEHHSYINIVVTELDETLNVNNLIPRYVLCVILFH